MTVTGKEAGGQPHLSEAHPVELVERALVNSSEAGNIDADLFGGSGWTLTGRSLVMNAGSLQQFHADAIGILRERVPEIAQLARFHRERDAAAMKFRCRLVDPGNLQT
jgi:hypothetical protein